MTKNRYETGMENLKLVDGKAGEDVVRTLCSVAPDVAKYIIEFAFGDIYDREGLSLQEREIITISSLLSLGGCENQLKVHINGALNVGLPASKIIEVFIQCIPYTGFPRVLNAIMAAKSVFEERNIEIEEPRK